MTLAKLSTMRRTVCLTLLTPSLFIPATVYDGNRPSKPMPEVDENIWISPFSKVPMRVIVLGVMASKGKKCMIIFVPDDMKVTANFYQALLQQHMMT
jgi:hypothetical protein